MKTTSESPIIRSFAHLIALAICLAGIVTLRGLEPADETIVMHGIYDHLGHAFTALVAALAVRAIRLPVPVWSVLLGGMVLDLGHVPQTLGIVNALEGSTRNGSHSLAFVVLLASLGFLDQRRANIWLGIAIGATSHLWRDMGTGTVALMWPITETVYGTLFTRYLAVLAGVALAMIGTATLLSLHERSRKRDQSAQVGPTSQASGWGT